MEFYKKEKAVLGLFSGNVDEGIEKINIGSIDASTEKHVPVYYVDGSEIDVHVGEVLHPMEDNHYIMWIAMDTGDKFYMTRLNPGEEAKTRFPYVKGSVIYAYCNLHGLWQSEVE